MWFQSLENWAEFHRRVLLLSATLMYYSPAGFCDHLAHSSNCSANPSQREGTSCCRVENFSSCCPYLALRHVFSCPPKLVHQAAPSPRPRAIQKLSRSI